MAISKFNKQYIKWRKTVAIPYLLNTQGAVCKACHKASNQLDVDHIIPRSHDRSRIMDVKNIQFLCRPCHMDKSGIPRL